MRSLCVLKTSVQYNTIMQMFNCIQKFSLLHNIKNFKMLPEETKPEKKFAVGIYCFHHMFINQLLIIKLKY